MSVAEFPSGAPSSAAEFERTPPQDVAAEQGVLGGMMLSKDAIADVVEIIRSADFYRPAHQTVYDAALDLYGRGEPVDAVTVSAELTRRGELGRVGGAPYLHTLISSVPTAASAGYYARIVRERAILRRLVEAGTKIVQLGYAAEGGEVDDIVDRAQAEVYSVTERRTSEDYLPLAEIMEGTLDEIEAIGSRGGGMVGVPTGFADLDGLTNGLHPGQMIVLAGRPAMGKALALNTPLATPTGWTTMAEVQVGDLVLGADGRPTTVVAATEVMTGRPCFEVVFSDGSTLVADADHQWLTDTRASRRRGQQATNPGRMAVASVKTTAEIAASLRCPTADARLNHSVTVTRPLQFPHRELPLPPYALGVWLGDGDSAGAAYTSADPEIAMHVEADGLDVSRLNASVREALPGLGPLSDKHIPLDYLRASEVQRRALLAGLLDTDGTVTNTGSVQFCVTSRRLAEDARELVTGLGYRSSMRTKRVKGRSEATSTAHALNFAPTDEVFRLERKRQLHKERGHRRFHRRGSRFVTAVRPVPSVPVRCIQVDNADHLYLAGRSMIPTHNSTLGLDFARAASIKHGLASVIFSLEMGRNEITMRLLSAEARVALHHMRSGTMSDDDWTRLARRMSEVASAPLFIDDSPNMSMMEIRAKCRRLKQRHDLRLVVVDYMQLMTSMRRVENRQQEVSEISRSLKLLAKELGVPVIAVSQLNRGPEQRTDKRPLLSDLRESGCLTADTCVLRADTGAETSLGELLATGERNIPVWSLDESLRLVPRTMTHVFPSGTKPVFELRLASGRSVKATANHPFLTYDGWQSLDQLTVGSRVAVPRELPEPRDTQRWPDSEVVMLAHLIRNGCNNGNALPASVFSLPRDQVGLFLRHLCAVDGSVGRREKGGDAPLCSSTSRRLVEDISRLFLRVGMLSRTTPVKQGVHRVTYHLYGHGAEKQARRLEEVGLDGQYGEAGRAFADRLCSVRGSINRRTTRSGGAAAVLDRSHLRLSTTSDVFWDEVVAIDPLGEQAVYDATVLGTHNFIADGISVHNSIEQDSDMVILLHREDAYERESPRAGEADLIVAKHRNGPTSTITVAFQGHYSRFVDMAHS